MGQGPAQEGLMSSLAQVTTMAQQTQQLATEWLKYHVSPIDAKIKEMLKSPEAVMAVQHFTAGIMAGLALFASIAVYAWCFVAEGYMYKSGIEGDGGSGAPAAGVAGAGSGETEEGDSDSLGETGGSGATTAEADGWRWRSVMLGGLVMLNIYFLTYMVVAMQAPLMAYLDMSLIHYNS